MRFYLGSHMPHWLSKTDVPLFISHRRLRNRKTFPRAQGPWALDSGGFTELSMFGEWAVSPAEYIKAVRRYSQEIGEPDLVSPQDWMCESWIIQKTGLSVAEHQRRTVDNYLELKTIASDLPIRPVLQGESIDDYFRCADLYASVGVHLYDEPVVGVGSVCRRQNSDEIKQLFEALSALGLNLHGFGVKTAGLKKYGKHLASCDSMAWSFAGRYVDGCTDSHKTEANCLEFALKWRSKVLSSMNC